MTRTGPTVLDASAILAFLQAEPGSELVERHLELGASCGAANWSEVVQKLVAHQRGWEMSAALLASYRLSIEPVTYQDAVQAALLWEEHSNLSLADRLCLALARRLGAKALTTDREWGSVDPVQQIR